MKFINANQLAFVLDIKVNDARAKMCHAWAKYKGIENTAEYNKKGKIVDSYPPAMEVDMLAEQLNLPNLQQAITDIQDNFLKRPAYRKWILCDYPEKIIQKMKEAGKVPKITIPTGLRSLLSNSDITKIKTEWTERFSNIRV